MVAPFKSAPELKKNSQKRLQYIEIMAFYTGLVTRSDVASSFGISDAAATKDLKLYNQLAPDNLLYKHGVFGFVPTNQFVAMFADLSPSKVLPMMAANLAVSAETLAEDSTVYGVPMEMIPLPLRLPSAGVCAQIVRAAKQGKQLQVNYHSLSGHEGSETRLIEPHALINSGLRWHVRAYSHNRYDFRDYVLSRFVDASMLDTVAESSPDYDDDWVEMLTLKLSPHPKLDAHKQQSLIIDYKAEDNIIELEVRRALVGYVLQRLSVDTTADHSMNPDAYHLIIINRDEIEPFAGWAFL